MKKEILNPYYRRNNRIYFRKNGKRTIIERTSKGVYVFNGDVIADVQLNISFKGGIDLKADIKQYP